MKCISMASTIVGAKDVSHTVVSNKRFSTVWKNDLIMICNDAISGFNPVGQNGSDFVNSILSKIEKDKLKNELTWLIRAQIADYYAKTDDYNYNYYNYSLQLKYNNLSIEILAKTNQ